MSLLSCNQCSSPYIVNKKYNLCDSCNFIRLNGKSKAEVYSERQQDRDKVQVTKSIQTYKVAAKPKDVVTPKKKTDKAKKQERVSVQLSALKKEIRQEAIDNDEYYCQGCLKYHSVLDCSHILSVGRFKQYELIKQNLQLLCRTCHLIWESGRILKQLTLHCFWDNINFIKTLEEGEYNKFIIKINEKEN